MLVKHFSIARLSLSTLFLIALLDNPALSFEHILAARDVSANGTKAIDHNTGATGT